MPTATRTYGQLCPIARSLDVVGERWSLLIVRELLLGPKRFKDLLSELPGLGTNRLSDRLKSLEADGVVERTTLPAPGAVGAYRLTDFGEGLRQPLVALAQWGTTLPPDDRLDPATARGVLLALVRCATAPAELLGEAREIYDFTIGDERFHVVVSEGRAMPRSGPAPIDPDVAIACDLPTLAMLATGALSPTAARREGALRTEGRAQAVRRALALVRGAS